MTPRPGPPGHGGSKIIPRPGDGELGEDDSCHAGLDDDADDRLEAHDDDRDLALLGSGSKTGSKCHFYIILNKIA